jgi:uncharacterized caspase-like protein/ribosomal protein L39E
MLPRVAIVQPNAVTDGLPMKRLQAIIAVLCWLAAATAAVDAETRVALVVGNNAYQHTAPLANPLNDARDMSAALRAAGFDVIEVLDADKRELDGAVRTFADKLSGADVALFFYAGHGLQVGAQNYLVPTDARLEGERSLEFEAVRLEFVLRQMEIDREGKTSIVILDACRDNPLSRNLARSMGTRSTAIGRGLAAAPAGLGTFIAYSTQPGNVALDGAGRNSPFTAALVKHMGVAGRNLPATMIEVRKSVVGATGGRQVPWDHSALTGDFYFVPAKATAAQGSRPTAPGGASADVAALQARLAKLEEAARKGLANARPVAKGSTLPPIEPPPSVPEVSPDFQMVDNVRIEGLKIGEQRQPRPIACRESCARMAGCVAFQHGKRIPVMGMCQTFSRVDARRQDRHWRSGVRQGAFASEEQTAAPSPVSKITAIVGAPPGRRDKGFVIWDGVSVMGRQIKMSATDSPAGCLTVCRHTPGCVAVTYNDFFRGKNVACSVYGEVTGTMKAPSSTLMVRSD